MGLYNFKERFVPFILRGKKKHTIRAIRKYPDKPGNILYLYTGLRTKKAKLLKCVRCVKLEEIQIFHLGGDLFGVQVEGMLLSRDEKETLACRDGFSNFQEMMNFWDGRLPFAGHVIHWQKL